MGFGNEMKVQDNKDAIGQDAISIIQDGIELYCASILMTVPQSESQLLHPLIKRSTWGNI